MLRAMYIPRFMMTNLSLGLALATLVSMSPAFAKGRVSAKAKVAPKVETPAPAPEPIAEPAEEPSLPPPAAEEPAQEPPAKAETPASAPPCLPLSLSPRNHTLWIDGGFRWDSGNFSRTEQVGGNRDNNNDDVNSLGPLLHLGYLYRLNRNIAMGAVFGYGASYDLNNEDLLIGQLLNVAYVADFSAPLSEKFSILGAPQAGLTVLLPGGILKERIDANQLAGYDTWSGPRYGIALGFDAGVRYKVTPWFNLRATVGYTWNLLFLLDSKAQGQTVSASQSWQVQTSRVGGTLGVELNF